MGQASRNAINDCLDSKEMLRERLLLLCVSITWLQWLDVLDYSYSGRFGITLGQHAS